MTEIVQPGTDTIRPNTAVQTAPVGKQAGVTPAQPPGATQPPASPIPEPEKAKKNKTGSVPPIRNFTVVQADGTESGIYTGRQPRQAAKKAIRRIPTATAANPVTIRLREKGTRKVHIYQGYNEDRKAPEHRPKWVPEIIQETLLWKIDIEYIE